MKTVLCISGVDPCGCAGQLADVKAVHGTGAHALAVATALTVQNTMSAAEVYPVSEDIMVHQLDHMLEDMLPDAVKIGMVYTVNQAVRIRNILDDHSLPKVVWDPVMHATSGTELMKGSDRKAILETLLPVVDLLTPNLDEAVHMAETLKCTLDELPITLFQTGVKGLLLKGGHAEGAPIDTLHTRKGCYTFAGPRIQTRHSRGTGCSLSSAIASYWAQDYSLQDAIRESKSYIRCGLRAGYAIGKGSGPIQHFNRRRNDE